MRANITVVINLPAPLEDFIDGVNRLTATLEDPTVFRASFVEYSQRDGEPAHVSLTIGGEVVENT